jgi:hypothetical protein
VETHYTIERPTESYRQPAFYRPELDQVALEKVVGETIEKYRHDDFEREKLENDNQTRRYPENEIPLDVRENNADAKSVEAGLDTQEIQSEVNLEGTPQLEPLPQVDPLVETPELYESYELPVADLELLLIELDANPLEMRPEKSVEPEGAVEQ